MRDYCPKPPPVSGKLGVVTGVTGVVIVPTGRTLTAHVAVSPALVTVKVLRPLDA